MKSCDYCKEPHSNDRPVKPIRVTIGMLRNLGDPETSREQYNIYYKDCCESCFENVVKPNLVHNCLRL